MSLLSSNPSLDVAVFRMDHLGDAVLTSGFLATLRSHLPDSIITVFSSEVSAHYFARCPYVNHVVPMPFIPPVHRNYPQAQEFLRQFRERFRGAFDIAINPRPAPDWFCSSVYVGATEAPLRIAFRQREFVDGLDPNGYYNELVDLPAELEHPAFVTRHLLEHLGVDTKHFGPPRIWVGKRASSKADSLLSPGRWIAVGVGAAYPHKIWPPENYAVVVNAMSKQGYRSVLLGTANERVLAEKIMKTANGHAIDLTGNTNVEEMAAVIKRCAAFVGNDSGPKHIAAALGVPVIEIFSISKDTPGFEYDRNFTVIGVKNCRISPEGPHSIEATHSGAAIRTIQPETVISKLGSLLSD